MFADPEVVAKLTDIDRRVKRKRHDNVVDSLEIGSDHVTEKHDNIAGSDYRRPKNKASVLPKGGQRNV